MSFTVGVFSAKAVRRTGLAAALKRAFSAPSFQLLADLWAHDSVKTYGYVGDRPPGWAPEDAMIESCAQQRQTDENPRRCEPHWQRAS